MTGPAARSRRHVRGRAVKLPSARRGRRPSRPTRRREARLTLRPVRLPGRRAMQSRPRTWRTMNWVLPPTPSRPCVWQLRNPTRWRQASANADGSANISRELSVNSCSRTRSGATRRSGRSSPAELQSRRSSKTPDEFLCAVKAYQGLTHERAASGFRRVCVCPSAGARHWCHRIGEWRLDVQTPLSCLRAASGRPPLVDFSLSFLPLRPLRLGVSHVLPICPWRVR